MRLAEVNLGEPQRPPAEVLGLDSDDSTTGC